LSSLLEQVKSQVLDGREAEVRAMLRDLIEQNPGDFEPVSLLAGIMVDAQQWQSAIELVESRLSAGIRLPELYDLLGNTLASVGRMTEAEVAYRNAIALDPSFDPVYRHLSAIRRFGAGDDLLARIEKRIERLADGEGQGEVERALTDLFFAAGKLCDDAGFYDKAFDYYRRANERAARDPERSGAALPAVESLERVFSTEFFTAREGFGSSSELPVLVVGMPRSGTTLMEQMLAAHPMAFGAGELRDLAVIAELSGKLTGVNRRYPETMPHLSRKTAAALGERYVERMQRQAADPRLARGVDKYPQNFYYLGLFKLMLPRARVIHMRRHPLDNLLSSYFLYFDATSTALAYTYSIESWCEFYRGYRRLMDHWNRVLPDFVLEVSYEDLVTEPERELRRVLDFCGLPWDYSCLNFNRNEQAIRTASVWQVRQPLHGKSVMRWKNYEKHLGVAADMLKEYL